VFDQNKDEQVQLLYLFFLHIFPRERKVGKVLFISGFYEQNIFFQRVKEKHSGIIIEKKTITINEQSSYFNHVIFSIAGEVFSFKFDVFSMNAS
jgi:hypothetical protein